MTVPVRRMSLQTSFVAYPLRFELQAIDPIHLHAHNGSALRGMLYRAALAITQGHVHLSDLDFIPDPVLRRLLATLDEADPRGQDAPRPYVIDPPDHLPDDEAHIVSPGETFSFGITLFGQAMLEAFPIIVLALHHAGAHGLGRFLRTPDRPGSSGRGRFRLVAASVHNPLTRIHQDLLRPDERLVYTPQVCITHADIMRQAERDAQAAAGRLRLYFHTPTTLRAQGQVVRQPSFSVLIHRLIERLERLSRGFGDGLIDCLPADRQARNDLLRRADAVRSADDRTRFVTVRGYSNRTRTHTNLSGFIGWADYEGEDFAPFLPLLRWGEWTHVGNHAVKGNGLFRLRLLSQPDS
jgi:hypothetical protein